MTYLHCPYSGIDILTDEANIEHIIPLALGGADSFTIRVAKDRNALFNREIDEPLKKSLFIATARRRHDARGHRKTDVPPPKVKARLTKIGTPLRLAFAENNKLRIENSITHELITDQDILENGLQLSISVETNLRLRFTAKVALAGGFFVYREKFFEAERALRTLANYGGQYHNEHIAQGLELTGWQWPREAPSDGALIHAVLADMAVVFDCSLVLFLTSVKENHLLVVVALLGELAGALMIPVAEDITTDSPDFDLGHVFVFERGACRRTSFRNMLLEYNIRKQSAGAA